MEAHVRRSDSTDRDGSPRLLFIPVSGPRGMGEFARCNVLAQGLAQRHRDWDIRIVISREAPIADTATVPVFLTSRSPTKVPEELERILREFAPDVAVFDSSGRQSSLQAASRMGCATVFVSNHRPKRRKAFRLSRLRYTDEHWILRPRFISGELTMLERWKLRWLRKPEPLFVDTWFPPPEVPPTAPSEDFFVACPGGGGNQVNGRQSAAIFADAARRISEGTGLKGVVVCGPTFTGELPTDAGLIVHRAVPAQTLLGLISAARMAVIGGGDLLTQTVALGIPAIAAPMASDQASRIDAFAGQGLCLKAPPGERELAETAISAWSDGRLSAVVDRMAKGGVTNGWDKVIERIELRMQAANGNNT